MIIRVTFVVANTSVKALDSVTGIVSQLSDEQGDSGTILQYKTAVGEERHVSEYRSLPHAGELRLTHKGLPVLAEMQKHTRSAVSSAVVAPTPTLGAPHDPFTSGSGTGRWERRKTGPRSMSGR
ncbi:hypothetical protein J6590_056744 [Homalodisca vitripennis]|nr:hypothetical protein J6590_056744 [Homalodisca vitripennis]